MPLKLDMRMPIDASVEDVLHALIQAGGVPLIVGGAVRDYLLGIRPKDFDIEVYRLPVEQIQAVLATFGPVSAVGTSFGVLKVRLPDGRDLDVALPRRESKTGQGHKGFLMEADPTMGPWEAAARRDFTWNALAYNVQTGEVLDYFGGEADLRAGIIRHTSEAFREDPLRVLRGMQFAARFGFVLDIDTRAFAIQLFHEYHDLSIERVWGEWEKFFQKGAVPSAGLRVLLETCWVQHYPELLALVACEQEPAHHPEGDVWAHTLFVADAAAVIAERDQLHGDDRVVLIAAAICHDLGKPATTERNVTTGKITSYGHDVAGEAPTRSFLARIGFPQRLIERVVVLVREHMVHVHGGPTPRLVRRLAHRLHQAGESLAMLGRLIEADHSGRPPLPPGQPFAPWLDLAAELDMGDQGQPPILQGRDLIKCGYRPGPAFGPVLKAAFDAQLDGRFSDLDGALAWLEEEEQDNARLALAGDPARHP